MSTVEVKPPFAQYNGLDGQPLESGYLYIGTENLDPITNPITVYWNSALSITAAQPIRLINGYPSNNGAAGAIFAASKYSVKTKDSNGSNVFSSASEYGLSIDTTLRADLAASSGSSLVGFLQAGAGAVAQTVRTKARERVSVADFLTNPSAPSATESTTALQAAINSGAKRVYITGDYTINGGLTLVANQILDFDGGSLTVQAGTVAANGILYGTSKYGVTIKDPIINASPTSGIGGINLIDCANGKVVRGQLTKCNLNFQASSTTTRMGYSCRDTYVDMSGLAVTACYVSAAKGVRLSGVELTGGREGFGIYNGATNVKHTDCDSYGHTQDGFVVISGSNISYSGCTAYSNAQSGFTTQRQTAGTDTVKISFANCHAYLNIYDGFDLRGANSVPFNADIFITATACQSYSNSGTGFYVVCAEGTTLTGCVASANLIQGFAIQESARTILTGCRSNSNASTVGAGTSKAGILIQDAPYVQLNGCVSTNASGATQSYGASFIGAGSTNGSVSGGNYENNSTAPIYLGASGIATYVTGAAIQTTGNVWCDTITANTGAYSETGFGVPAHTRPKGSIFRRTDGAGGEIYITNGGGVWISMAIP